MPDKGPGSSNHRSNHRDNITPSPITSYIWRDLTRPSSDHEGQGHTSPPSRCKHASCHYDDYIYVHGGRNGGVCYRDLWRYKLADASWVKLRCRGDQPMSPQEHTVIAYKNNLYVFGGQFCFSSDKDTPLWILNLDTLVWRKSVIDSEVVTPSGRRGHSAVLYDNLMCVYGGYVDLKGSSSEVWILDLKNEIWHVSNVRALYDYMFIPDGRHGHSAVVYDAAMFVYGGMADLLPKDDLWRWDFIGSQWNRIKCRPSPPPLKGHSACVVTDKMLIHGGSSQGSFLNTLWCFHFGSTTWCRLATPGLSPPASMQHTVVIVTNAETAPTTKHDRSISHPQLRENPQEFSKSTENERPFSSPPDVSTSRSVEQQESHSVFKNKVVPKGPPPSYDSVAEEIDSTQADVLSCDSKDGNVLSGHNHVHGHRNEKLDIVVRSGDGFGADDVVCSCDGFGADAVVDVSSADHKEAADCVDDLIDVRRTMWRSMGCISTESMRSDDIPLMELNRSHTTESVSPSSAEYMDTVAGCHVNRIITDVNNMLVRGVSIEAEGAGGVTKKKRHSVADNSDAPMAKRSTSLEDVLGGHHRNRIVQGHYESGSGQGHGGGGTSQAANTCSRLPAPLRPSQSIVTDDLTLEDLEDAGSSSYLKGARNQYIMNDTLTSSDDILNISNSSESAPLVTSLGHPQDSCPQQAGLSKVRCFTRPGHSRSSDSLPYGMTNPLYSAYNDHSQATTASTVSPPQSKPTGNATNQRIHGNNPEELFNQNYSARKTGRQSTSGVSTESSVDHREGANVFNRRKESSNPRYSSTHEMIELSDMAPREQDVDCREKSITIVLPEHRASLTQAWGDHAKRAETTLNGKHDNQRSSMKSTEKHEILGAERGATAVVTPPIPLSPCPSQHLMYILGGQTSDSKAFGYNPLVTWRLRIHLGPT